MSGFEEIIGAFLGGSSGNVAGSTRITSVSPTGGTSRPSKTDLRFMEQRLDNLSLICEGMWQLLKHKHGYTDKDLMAEMAHLDLADGRADGKNASRPKARPCPHCGRTVSRRHTSCMYCGQLVKTQPFA